MSEQRNKVMAGLKATGTLIAIILVMASVIGIGVALKLGFLVTKIAVVVLMVMFVSFLVWDHLRIWFLKKLDEEDQEKGGEV